MKVWHLSSNRWNSAITEYALSAARALAMRGHPTVFFPLAGSPAEARARGYELETRPLPAFGLRALGVLRGMAARERPDWIIAYGGPESQLAKGLPGRTARFRGQDVPRGLVADLAQKLALAGLDRVIAPSVFIEQQLQGLFPAAKVRIVTLGVDASKYRRVLGDGRPARPMVVVLGRLDPVKGHAAILDLMKPVWAGWGEAQKPLLHIIGEPANLSADDLRRLIAERKAENDVLLTAARVADVAGILSGAALGVVPSLGSEVICRVAEEFLLCGTPVLVSGAGSLNEILFRDAGASYAGCKPAEAAALMRKWIVRSVAEGEARKAERASNARARFSLEAMGAGLEAALGV